MYSICKPKVCLGPIRCSGCFHFFKIIDNEGWCVCKRERKKERICISCDQETVL